MTARPHRIEKPKRIVEVMLRYYNKSRNVRYVKEAEELICFARHETYVDYKGEVGLMPYNRRHKMLIHIAVKNRHSKT